MTHKSLSVNEKLSYFRGNSPQALLKGLNAKQSGSGWIALCPAHDDHNPSLSIEEKDGKILLHCHAGCPNEKVISALRRRGLWSHGNPQGSFNKSKNDAAKPTKTHAEFFSHFKHLLQTPIPEEALAYLRNKRSLGERIVKDLVSKKLVAFSEKKRALTFLIVSHDRRTFVGLQYIPVDGSEKTLARGSKMSEGFFFYDQSGGTECVVVTEAVIDALSVASAYEGANVVSVLSAGSLQAKLPKIQTSDHPPILFVDNDRAGNDAIDKVLATGNKHLRLIDFGQFPSGVKDANDLLRGGHGDLIERLLQTSRTPTADEITAAENRVTVEDNEDDDFNPEPWPTLSEKALRGIARDFIALATRSSEGDPAAILATFLCRFGVEVGSAPHMMIGDTRHPALINSVIVGNSSKARKGTSGGPVSRLFKLYEFQVESSPTWMRINDDFYRAARETPGPLSSGEGLIYAVRDEVKEWVADKKTGEGKTVVTDPGVTDKRLFVLDEEFAAALGSTKREGNTLSAIIRAAFDGKDLEPLTKRDRIKASRVHVGIVTHVTTFELHRLLESTQVLNGFANRFLWVCARRQKLVPFPDPMPEEELKKLQRRLLEILWVASQAGRVTLDKNALDKWYAIYPVVSQEHSGFMGCVINRGEALVMRLAMIYALLDASPVISVDHLDAALAFWAYAKESAEFIFAGREVNPLAHKILDALREEPLSLTEIYRLFSNHANKQHIKSTLNDLISSRQISMKEEKTAGRTKKIFSHTLCEESEESESSSNPIPLISLFSHDSQGVCEKQISDQPGESPVQTRSEASPEWAREDDNAQVDSMKDESSSVLEKKRLRAGLDFNDAGPQQEDEPQRKPALDFNSTWMTNHRAPQPDDFKTFYVKEGLRS